MEANYKLEIDSRDFVLSLHRWQEYSSDEGDFSNPSYVLNFITERILNESYAFEVAKRSFTLLSPGEKFLYKAFRRNLTSYVNYYGGSVTSVQVAFFTELRNCQKTAKGIQVNQECQEMYQIVSNEINRKSNTKLIGFTIPRRDKSKKTSRRHKDNIAVLQNVFERCKGSNATIYALFSVDSHNPKLIPKVITSDIKEYPTNDWNEPDYFAIDFKGILTENQKIAHSDWTKLNTPPQLF